MQAFFAWAAPMGNELTITGALIVIFGSLVAALGVYGTNLASDHKDAEIADLLTKNTDLNEELYAYARGGDSYAYLRGVDLGGKNQRIALVHCGQHPVRNLTIEVRPREVLNDQNLTWDEKAKRFTVVSLNSVVPGEESLLRGFPLDTQSHVYRVFLRAENGSLMQMLAWLPLNDQVLQGYVVVRRVNGNSEPLHEYADPGFPPTLLESMRRDAGLAAAVTVPATC